MERRAPRRQQLVVRDLADAIVGEIEPLPHRLEETAPHELLRGGGGVRLVEAGHLGEQAEGKRPADDRGRVEGAPRRLGQPGQPADHGVADRRGEAQGSSGIAPLVRRQGA
jgi:hypothetical protein